MGKSMGEVVFNTCPRLVSLMRRNKFWEEKRWGRRIQYLPLSGVTDVEE